MKFGVVLMAYGSPGSPEEVGPYLKDIRGGREPDAAAIEELTARYERVGWSPLLEITMRQGASLEKLLEQMSEKDQYLVRVGMKHWFPYISESVGELLEEEIDGLIGLVLAPHYSSISIGGYQSRIEEAMEDAAEATPFEMVDSWYENPRFVEFVGDRIREAAQGWKLNEPGTRIFFTAHSLPARIIDEGDPYKDQLLHSSKLIAAAAGAENWEFAFQSASHTGVPWLGPDILGRLDTFAKEGGKRALIAPIGFTSDHLEILFDVDVECMEKAKELNLELRRIASPNDDPAFIEVLAEVVLGR